MLYVLTMNSKTITYIIPSHPITVIWPSTNLKRKETFLKLVMLNILLQKHAIKGTTKLESEIIYL